MEIREDGVDNGRKIMRGNNWDKMGKEDEQEMFGAATEFCKFSTVTRGGGHPVGVRGGGGRGYAGHTGGVASGSHGGHEVRDDQSWEGSGGMKRKLFSEPAGPQLLE